MSHAYTPPRALAHFPSSLQELVQQPDADSLHLLLETAGARATWLAHRFASAGLEQANATVVLVTWSQSTQFWSSELRKSASIDYDQFVRTRNLVILDQSDLGTATAITGAHTLTTRVNAAIKSTPSDRGRLLILDSPDLLLGLEGVSGDALLAVIQDLRILVKSVIVLTSSNIFSTASHEAMASPLQIQQQQFLTSLIHQADTVMATRVLDTGQARDVSGVLRFTRGGQSEIEGLNEAAGREYLYHVDASRTARIWQRGSER